MADMRERGMTFLRESSDFAVKGKASDLAIVVTIGAMFGAIVSSIVDHAFLPLVGLVIGDVDFSNMFVVLSNPADVPVLSLAAA